MEIEIASWLVKGGESGEESTLERRASAHGSCRLRVPREEGRGAETRDR